MTREQMIARIQAWRDDNEAGGDVALELLCDIQDSLQAEVLCATPAPRVYERIKDRSPAYRRLSGATVAVALGAEPLTAGHLATLSELADDLERIVREVSSQDGGATARQHHRVEAVRAVLARLATLEAELEAARSELNLRDEET